MHGRITSDSGEPYYGMPYDRLYELAVGRGKALETLRGLLAQYRVSLEKWISFYDYSGKSKTKEVEISAHREASQHLVN